MKTIKKGIYIFIQCTWGGLQTLLGLIFFLVHLRYEHQMYRCCIDTKWNKKGGLSLGLFTFTPKDDVPGAQRVRVHEYGHTIQSLFLGPLMVPLGIISVVWCNLPYFVHMRAEKGIPYTACFVESWASRWGEKVTGEEAI